MKDLRSLPQTHELILYYHVNHVAWMAIELKRMNMEDEMIICQSITVKNKQKTLFQQSLN